MYKLTIIFSASIMLAACTIQKENATTTVNIANPASVYCLEQGGKTVMRTNKDGQYGVCVFKNGNQIDEWQYYRQNHKK